MLNDYIKFIKESLKLNEYLLVLHGIRDIFNYQHK